jgi:exocyst complex component 4
MKGPDAFMPDASSTWLSTEPLVNVSVGMCTGALLAMRLTISQASTAIMALINSLCVMLRTTPFHRENYARLVLTVIIQFYQRCSDRFQSLITSQTSSDQDPRLALGAQWAQIPDIAACLSDLYHALVDGNNSMWIHPN